MQKLLITLGAYSVFLRDWIDVFSNKSVLVIQMEDYSQNMEQVLKRVYKFLGLSKIKILIPVFTKVILGLRLKPLSQTQI